MVPRKRMCRATHAGSGRSEPRTRSIGSLSDVRINYPGCTASGQSCLAPNAYNEQYKSWLDFEDGGSVIRGSRKWQLML